MLESPSNPIKTRIFSLELKKNFEPQNRIDWSTPRGWWRHQNV